MGDSKPPRVRRKQLGGAEHVKHRRTRSGCFTCRTRRVKCDEAQPTCERCRKGSRECIYPEPSAKSKLGPRRNSAHSSVSSEGGLEDGDGDDDDDEMAEADGEGTSVRRKSSSSVKMRESPAKASKKPSPKLDLARKISETPSLMPDKSPTPSTEGSIALSAATIGSTIPNRLISPWTESLPLDASSYGRVNWSHLPSNLQFYLHYHVTHLTHHHYSLKHDSTDFLRTTLLEIAIKNRPLLYSVVGFAAFQHTLTHPNGKLEDFLGFYNQSVSLLRESLRKNRKHTIATLMTILQLATIEEFLGDWVNLLGHQRASYEILIKLFTPETVTATELSRVVFGWYSRFDVFAGIMAAQETVLGREWLYSLHQYHLSKCQMEPDNIDHKVEAKIAETRLLGVDLASLFAQLSKGNVTREAFLHRNAALSQQIAAWGTTIDPMLQDSKYRANSFEGTSTMDSSMFVNSYNPDIYKGPIWSMNYAFVDWWAVDMMHRYQTSQALQVPPPEECFKLAMKTCQVYEAIQHYPDRPPGALLPLQASLAMLALFLPSTPPYTIWLRRNFAQMENMGYIYPTIFRNKMALHWNDPEINNWWLPNNENYLPIIRSIRSFVEDRRTPPKDSTGTDLRDMKAIFSSLNLKDGGVGGGHQHGENATDAVVTPGMLPSTAFEEGNLAWTPGGEAEGMRFWADDGFAQDFGERGGR